MPICLERDPSGAELLQRTSGLVQKPACAFQESSANCIDIGLLNNMPDAALQSTERQFLTLMDSASAGLIVRFSFYSLPDIPRSDAGRRHLDGFYSGVDDLCGRHLDGLIVTGAEPRAPQLIDEPYWGSLARVLDWAEHSTHSTVLSCLAAHAAVLHLDGIPRRRLDDKCFGLFDCDRASDHPLLAGAPARFAVPQSRWNEISEPDLAAGGYTVLTRASGAGIDSFLKKKKSLFLFFQGHPEYEANTLLLEYRRDIGRYLRRQSDLYPGMPKNYFDSAATAAFTSLEERALCDRNPEMLSLVPAAEKRLANTWRAAAAGIYGNWLAYLSAQKEQRLRRSRLHRRVSAIEGGLTRRLKRLGVGR